MESEWFGSGRPCDLTRYARLNNDVIADEMEELRKQNRRAAGVYRRLYEEKVPGVLLADEVGKGKTYVALGVAFALLAKKQDARVVILTHSRHMAKEWASRWSEQMKANCRPRYHQKFEVSGEWKPLSFTSFEALRVAYEEDVPPQLAIGSYETLKKYSDKLEEASFLKSLLQWTNDCYGVYLSTDQRRLLTQKIIGPFDFRRTLSPFRISASEAHRFLRECFDPFEKEWKVRPRRVRDLIDVFVADSHRQTLAHQIDLLIVDEAHKLEGTARQRVVTRLLHKRFRKCLFVTATPFALSVEQFRRRLLEFRHASTSSRSFVEEIERLPLADFARAVEAGEHFAGQTSLELTLRKFIVRDTWDHTNERHSKIWKAIAKDNAIVPTLLLERIIDGVLSEKEHTHIASRRESLCSSWAAAVQSFERSPLVSVEGWSELFSRVVSDANGGAHPDPKMITAVIELTKLALNGRKVVLFTQRNATAMLLHKLLRASLGTRTSELSRRSNYWRRQVDRLETLLGFSSRATRVLGKILAHSPDAPERWNPLAVRRWWAKHSRRAFAQGEQSLLALENVLGRGRRLPLVIRFDSDGESSDSHAIEKFNLPSAPVLLIATPRGQEGIDLHRYCRRVVLYDLTWNPAHMEQRIGRVHRLGGNHSAARKVEVVYCYQEGTYEAHMVKRVQERCKMLRVLLGAGQWLDEDQEIEDVDRYRMSFPP